MLVKNQNKKNKGQVLVIVALSLVLFIGVAALAIDVAYFYHTKHQLQGAADAAALAGAAKLLKDETNLDQPLARSEALLFANKNIAANSDVILEDGGLGDNTLSENNDITVGYWDGSTYYPGQTPVTAVQARARRTGESPGGAISTLFGKIFGIDTVNISATACAARFKAEVLPIVVNEYWMATTPVGSRPYGTMHNYPNSFVRQKNVDNTPSDPNDNPSSLVYGKIFAILGAQANSNVSAGAGKDTSSYVNLDARSHRHNGGGKSWGEVAVPSPPAVNCVGGNCLGAFVNYSSAKKTGFISQAKFDASLNYLHNGYPENYPLPTAIKEKLVSPYPGQSYTIYPDPTSECPFATVAYFPSSGNPLEKQIDGKKFNERYPKGKKLVALVYDGTYQTDIDPNAPNALTIIGYTLLQIDGYGNKQPKLLNLDITPNSLTDDGSTVYAHALISLVEPETGPGLMAECDDNYPKGIADLMIAGATYRLVQ